MRQATGRLTLTGPDGTECRIYFLYGRLYHAEGAAGEGRAILDDAMSWRSFTQAFDEDARLVSYETIGEEAEAALGSTEDEARLRAEVRRLRLQALGLFIVLMGAVALLLVFLYGRR